jgi:hypothetical protein
LTKFKIPTIKINIVHVTTQTKQNTIDNPSILMILIIFRSILHTPPTMDQTTSQIEDNDIIPEGFVSVMGPNGQLYLVPEFFAPAVRNSFEGIQQKKSLETKKAVGTVSCSFFVFSIN